MKRRDLREGQWLACRNHKLWLGRVGVTENGKLIVECVQTWEGKIYSVIPPDDAWCGADYQISEEECLRRLLAGGEV